MIMQYPNTFFVELGGGGGPTFTFEWQISDAFLSLMQNILKSNIDELYNDLVF
jgi:hypothetical protein